MKHREMMTNNDKSHEAMSSVDNSLIGSNHEQILYRYTGIFYYNNK